MTNELSRNKFELAKATVAVAAACLLTPPAAATVTIMVEVVSKLHDLFTPDENSRAKRVERSIEALPNISKEQRVNAHMHARLAIRSASLTLADLTELNFDPRVAASHTMGSLDRSLSSIEEANAGQVIEIVYREMIEDLRKVGIVDSARHEQLYDRVKGLEKWVKHPPPALRSANPPETTRHALAVREKKDILRHSSYEGDIVDECVTSLDFNWIESVYQHWNAALDEAHRLKIRIPDALLLTEQRIKAETSISLWARISSKAFSRGLLALAAEARKKDRNLRRPLPSATSWLMQEIREPAFGIAIALTGSWGAGKSRLLDEIAKRTLEKNWLTIFLNYDHSASLEDSLFKSVTEYVGLQISSRAQLNEELKYYAGACVLVDNMETLLYDNEHVGLDLIELMKQCSGLKLKWVLALDESAMPSLLDEESRVSWHQIAMDPARSRETISGWLNLSDYNHRHSVGIGMLSESGVSWNERRELIRYHNYDPARGRELSQPIYARLRSVTAIEAPLDEIHLSLVLEKYWDHWLEAINTYRRSKFVTRRRTEELCNILSKDVYLYGKSDETSLHVEWSPEDLIPSLRPEAIRRILNVLYARGFIRTEELGIVPGDSEPNAWGYLVSSLYTAEWEGLTTRSMHDLLGRMRLIALREDPASRSALRIGLIEIVATSTDENWLTTFCKTWLDDPELPNSPVWEASVLMHDDTRTGLMAYPRSLAPSNDEAFWAIRMISIAPPRTHAASLTALGFLERYADSIAEWGLDDYLLIALKCCIAKIVWSEQKDALFALQVLDKFDSTKVSASVAAEVVSHVNYITKDSRRLWIDILDFFTNAKASLGGGADYSRTFWAHLIEGSVESMGSSAGASILAELIDAGWYADGRSSFHVGARRNYMRHQGHIAFGRAFDWDRDNFLSMVDSLLTQRIEGMDAARQAPAALFGIRHSVRITGNISWVDPAMRSRVETLRRRQDLKSADSEYLARIRIRERRS